MRACPKCMTDNLDTAKFCKQCASPLQQSGGKTCPSGKHTMDPTWAECVYCRQENVSPVPPSPGSGAGRSPTMFEGQAPSRKPTEMEDMGGRGTPLPPRPPRPFNGPPSPPQGGGAVQAAKRPRESTVYRATTTPNPAGGQATPPVARDRKIVGILVTYSWAPEGQIFPIREGRNFIGRDKDCEVSVPEDQTLSGRNSHITYRQNFVVGDMVSMTGTDLDGVPIEEQFHSLGNYAMIRAGSTYFTFIAIQPPSSAAIVEPTGAESSSV
jgi:hypothetical protein